MKFNQKMPLSNKFSNQKDKMIYKAAKENAEAIILSQDLETRKLNKNEFTVSQEYKICQTVEELNDFKSKKGLDKYHWIEIPKYAVRIADEVNSFDQFEDKMLKQTPYEKSEID